ncbi:phosphate-regulating neutral endopeptidase PHEX-like isoform X1 [Dermacentor variabilis]|uniref:phosphate-regulating neutral endopeptidase PHEX-like isoform X1 n=2 Tax=Dermacentor variabilis TaxID=34621 RepID=UPI003F5C6B40
MNFKAIQITAGIWFLASVTAQNKDSETWKVCGSPECIQRAKLINESLNSTVHPCTDFYSYVCNGWESDHRSPCLNGSYDVFQEIDKKVAEKLSYILGNRTLVECNQTLIDKIAITYNACLALPDTSDALIRVLNESGINAWPILTEGNIFNSSNCTDLLRHMNISAILYVHIKNIKDDDLFYDNPRNYYGMAIDRIPDMYNIRSVPNIKVLVNNTIKLLLPQIESSRLANLTKELASFAQNVSYLFTEYYHFKAYNLSSLEAEYPTIPISCLVKKEFAKVNITLPDNYTFEVFSEYDDFSEFLATANPNTLYNYAGLLSMLPYIPYVNMSTEEAISNDLTQSTTRGRNWSECIALLDENMPDILDYLYVTNDTNHIEVKREVEEIADRLKQAFNETLQNNSWIGNMTRAALQKKLKDVTMKIGYPDTLLNRSALYEYVRPFPLTISFTEALYYIQKDFNTMELTKYRSPDEGQLTWDHSPRDGRTFHVSLSDYIEIPYALFAPPFFQQGLPRSLNYGGIGTTIAHELAHSLTYSGTWGILTRKYEKLIKDSLELFKNKTSCFKKQYKVVNKRQLVELDVNYNENTSAEADRQDYHWSRRLHVHWSKTLNEDLADNTGLQIAFTAYTKVLEEECAGQDTHLKGLEIFDGMQQFFMSRAMTLCKTADKYSLIEEIRRVKFSSPQNRVNVPLKNLDKFAKAFNCSLGSPMHPPKNETCSLW